MTHLIWKQRRESNPQRKLMKLESYRYSTLLKVIGNRIVRPDSLIIYLFLYWADLVNEHQNATYRVRIIDTAIMGMNRCKRSGTFILSTPFR